MQSRSGVGAASLILSAALLAPAVSAFGADEAAGDAARKDWPCKQILVETISLPAVWSGPPIDDVDWRKNEAVADLVAEIAPRKEDIDKATKAIVAFAAAGPDKNMRLTALFAGVFEELNDERRQIIEGLFRLARKQKDLAAKIRAENAQIQKAPEASGPVGVDPADNPAVQTLQWDLRLFDERRKSVTYACEAPTLVEQRLFALARAIQNEMD